jgi:endonuclease YncB( thermonuclease family)
LITYRARRALFRCALLAVLLAPAIAAAAAPVPFSAVVARVIDGDTVRLDDDTSVRLIGINCPELGYGARTAEPFAERARDTLSRLIGSGPVRVVPGTETRDRYGRLLAYLFAAKVDLQLELLKRGLASVVAIPPNIERLSTYQDAQRRAREQAIGIWQHPYFRAVSPSTLDAEAGRFVFVAGRVDGITRTRRRVYLRLDADFAIGVSHADFRRHWSYPLDTLLGQRIEVRGWLIVSRYGRSVSVRHPAMITVIGP